MLRFFEFYQDDKYYYLVTEYCAGGDLLSKTQELASLTEHAAAKIMKQILSAVDYCHKKRIIHR